MNNQNIFKLISRLLIAFGVMAINMFLFRELAQFICKNIYHIDILSYLNSGNFTNPTDKEIGASRLFFAIASFGIFLFSSFIIAFIFKQNPIAYLRLKKFPKPIYLIIVPCFLLAAMPFISWIIEVNKNLILPDFLAGLVAKLNALEKKSEDIYKLMQGANTSKDLFINIFVMALIPAIGEELFCRGVLLNVVYDYSGKFLKSVVIVAIIFTLFHMQFYKFMPMMVLAVILGLFINWTQSIWASILFHFLNNTTAVLGNFYSQRGVKNLLTDEHAHMPVMLTILSFLLTIALIIWLNKFSKRTAGITHE